MKNAPLAAALVAGSLALPLHAADTYTIDPSHTIPSFEVSHLGFSTQRGRFDKTSGKIVLDRAAKSGSVDVVIDTASISTGVPRLEDHLRAEDFLFVEQHPTIRFESTTLHFDGDALAAVQGNLTMRGVTRPVKLTVTHFRCAPHPIVKKEACGADAWTVVKRSDFGIKYALPAVADEVKLLLNVEAIKD